ncbi:GGDEF domain-containing protein [Eubacterium sp.]|uniref:GGDEF domain-containing protein n=1 Tax=Eubacterium sp. TaxID=142586 RepID=UPI0025DA83A6|nr:GGDEF domain-containing protein [Eubacterium sp.]MCR5629671.1 GGDEF domain-containing protein [Eubacterium sp.]
MKRKIAVFTNGWNDDYLEFALEGIRRRANEDKIDIFIFMEYTSYDKNEKDKIGELNILNLPDLKDFDGVLLLGNTLNTANENTILREKILDANVPSLCLEYQLEDINCIRTENSNGMKELMEHMINVHNVKDVFYISGPSDNAESNERYRAVVETMEKHGLKMNPDNVFDGCWSYAIVEENIPKIVKSLDKLPDAFICANDSMALATCIALEKIGISVPQDVRVTGFDNLMSGNYFSPMLTSVDRGWNERSYQAMDSLINLINGSPDFGDKLYDSKFDLGESCGCSMGEEGEKIQKEARMRAFSIPVERTIFDWHLIDIDDAVSKVKTVDDIHKGFSKLWETSHNYEGNEFYICLDQNFVDSMVKDVDSKSEGYSESLDVIYGMKDGVTIDRTSIPLNELVPNHNPNSSESEMYLFIPLHSGAECLGYYVCKNYISTIKDFYLNSLTRHISSGLERARQNIQLENLNKILEDMSVRDELTGLYNRMGYEKIVIPYLNDLRSSKKKSIIMVADINRMKVINDEFGHLQGDAAIRIIAYVLKSTVPANWKTVRYGGDEYVMIGEYDNEKDVEVVKNEIINKAKNMANELALPFKLSVSVGYVIVDTEDKVGNEEYFRMADEAMYEMKQKAHREA